VSAVSIAQIKPDGTYLVGNSSFGPTGATVVGNLAASANVSAGLGIAYNGTAGYSFAATPDSGLFSTGVGDLRLVVGGSAAVTLSPSLLTVDTALTVTGNATAAALTTTAGLTAGTDLTVNGRLLGGGTAISKFRLKGNLDLGTIAGPAATSNTYPNTIAVNYAGAQIEGVWLTAASADTDTTATTFNIVQNGAVIATIALGPGATSAFAYPLLNPTPLHGGDQLQAVCTAAGTASGATITLEFSQFLY